MLIQTIEAMWFHSATLKVVFYKLAQYHGFFAPKTKAKIIKDQFFI